jgi:hypothetical protein
MKGISSEWSFTSHNEIQHKKGYQITLKDGSWSAPLDFKFGGFADLTGPIMATHMQEGLEYAKNNFATREKENASVPLTLEMIEGQAPRGKTPFITYKKRRRIST